MSTEKASYKFKIVRLDARELADYQRLPDVRAMINHGFADSISKYPRLFGPEERRFQSEEQILDELGFGGVLFLVLLADPAEPSTECGQGEIVATAGYKPYERKWLLHTRYSEERKRVLGTGERRNMNEADIPAIQEVLESLQQVELTTNCLCVEVIAVVTSPKWRGHRLASQLLIRITEEMNARAIEAKTDDHRAEFKLMVRTTREINEAFWEKLGFRTVSERLLEAGLLRSTKGFHLVEMVREHIGH